MTGPGFHFEIKHANHYSFTDAPVFFAPPGRWLLAQVVGGGREPAATQQAAADSGLDWQFRLFDAHPAKSACSLTRQALYRHVAPNGELRADAVAALGRR